jgi:hypothetical protein
MSDPRLPRDATANELRAFDRALRKGGSVMKAGGEGDDWKMTAPNTTEHPSVAECLEALLRHLVKGVLPGARIMAESEVALMREGEG